MNKDILNNPFVLGSLIVAISSIFSLAFSFVIDVSYISGVLAAIVVGILYSYYLGTPVSKDTKLKATGVYFVIETVLSLFGLYILVETFSLLILGITFGLLLLFALFIYFGLGIGSLIYLNLIKSKK